MIRQSQRLRRVLRKYALDARLARIARAKAERERAHLLETLARIRSAQNAVSCGVASLNGNEAAALDEWSERLLHADASLQPAIDRATVDCGETGRVAHQAKGRMERIEERIAQAMRTEEQQSSTRSESRLARPRTGRNRQP